MWPCAVWYKFKFHSCHTTRRYIPEDYLFYYRYLFSFLFWTLLPTHCRCRGYFCTSSHTVTHTHTHTRSVELFWTRDRTVKETCMRATPAFTTDRLPCPPRDSKPQSQQARAAADPRLISRGHRNWLLKVFSEWDPGYKIQGYPCLIW